MNVEEGPPSNTPPSELVSQKSPMKKWLIVFGVVSVVGIVVGLSLYFLLPRWESPWDKACSGDTCSVLLLSTRTPEDGEEINAYTDTYGTYTPNVPMVIGFNGESHNECFFSYFLFIKKSLTLNVKAKLMMI